MVKEYKRKLIYLILAKSILFETSLFSMNYVIVPLISGANSDSPHIYPPRYLNRRDSVCVSQFVPRLANDLGRRPKKQARRDPGHKQIRPRRVAYPDATRCKK